MSPVTIKVNVDQTFHLEPFASRNVKIKIPITAPFTYERVVAGIVAVTKFESDDIECVIERRGQSRILRDVFPQLVQKYTNWANFAAVPFVVTIKNKQNVDILCADTADVFGAVAGISTFHAFNTRAEACRAGVHRSAQAGIVGTKEDGCYSVALSGFYSTDIDNGNKIEYTANTGNNFDNNYPTQQTRDQYPSTKFESLVTSCNTQKPIRLLRGYKLKSKFAPKRGYRYDGLYRVTGFRADREPAAGLKVYIFNLERIADQPDLVAKA